MLLLLKKKTPTSAARPLLFHKVAHSRPHGDREERSGGICARRQRQLPRPLHDAAGGHPMVHAQARGRLSRSGEESWPAQAIWSEQTGKEDKKTRLLFRC